MDCDSYTITMMRNLKQHPLGHSMRFQILAKYLVIWISILMFLSNFSSLCYAKEIKNVEPPTVTFSLNPEFLSEQLQKLSSLSERFALDIDVVVYNPNNFTIFLTGITFRVYLEGRFVSEKIFDEAHEWERYGLFPHETSNLGMFDELIEDLEFRLFPHETSNLGLLIGFNLQLTDKEVKKALMNNAWNFEGMSHFDTPFGEICTN